MRINGSPAPVAGAQASANLDALQAQRQARILKRALDSQQTAADQLLKMLEPKGKNLDIRA